MAKAKRCDRCDKYYDNNVIKREVAEHNGRMLPVDRINIIVGLDNRGSTMVSDRYDLCDECWNKFFNWLNVWKLDEEVDLL